jgi:thiol-disulfide isomerase/thioredoxin
MSFITMIIASAGLSLGFVGPDAKECAGDCEKACCETAEATKDACCALGSAAAEPELPKIESAAYGNAAWPAQNSEDDLYAKNLQGKTLPVALGNETILSKDMEMKDLKGKVVILDFWATWCGPCVAAAPKLAALQEAHAKDLMVVGIAGQREDESTVRAFIEKHDEPFMQLYDDKQTAFKPFESRGIPLVVVMSTDGVIRWMGNPHEDDFKTTVEQVIKADPMIQAKS